LKLIVSKLTYFERAFIHILLLGDMILNKKEMKIGRRDGLSAT